MNKKPQMPLTCNGCKEIFTNVMQKSYAVTDVSNGAAPNMLSSK